MAPQVDSDLTARKRAFFLLQKALPQAVAGRPPWALFLVLFDVLEESAYHLIKVSEAAASVSRQARPHVEGTDVAGPVQSVWAAHMARLFPLAEDTA